MTVVFSSWATSLRRKRLREEFEVGGFMALEGLWNIAEERLLEDRGAPRQKEGN